MKLELSEHEVDLIIGSLGAIVSWCSTIKSKQIEEINILFNKLVKLENNETEREKVCV